MDVANTPRSAAGGMIPRPPLPVVPATASSVSSATHSWDSQTVVGEESDEERKSMQQKASQRKILPRDVSDKLEPFEAMPVPLDRFAEALVSFYLLQYPKATYVFNQNLNPHPVYTNFAIAMNAPACFQIILARSALYKMSAGQYGTTLEKAELETAVVEHKTNAIHRVRHLSAQKVTDKDELIASIIALGTLDMRMGSTASADVHYSAVRRLLKDIGGPMNIRDIRLKRVMCFFECIYGTVRNSYIWETADFDGILEKFNQYLAEMWEMWKVKSGTPSSTGTAGTLKSEYPFPKTKMPVPTPGKWSTRMPSGPHSPYFGIQPLLEVVPKPKVVPHTKSSLSEPAVVPERIRKPPVSKPLKVPTLAKANKPPKRTSKDTRLPVKERAKQMERQKGKQNAMQVDEESPVPEVVLENQKVKQNAMQVDKKSPTAKVVPEKQKGKESSMQIDEEASGAEVVPEKQKATQDAMQLGDKSPASAVLPQLIEMPPPAISVDTPQRRSRNDRRSHWKLNPDTALHRRLTLWNELPEDKKTPALIWDLACLFCLSAIIADYADRDAKSLSVYMSKLSRIVQDANLHVSENNSNMMWLMQTNDSADEHNRRMWEVAACVWVCKHLNVNVKRSLRKWVFAYLTGEGLQRKITLTAFDFSYDRSMS